MFSILVDKNDRAIDVINADGTAPLPYIKHVAGTEEMYILRTDSEGRPIGLLRGSNGAKVPHTVVRQAPMSTAAMPMQVPMPTSVCDCCLTKESTLFRCAQCKETRYCNALCASAHWSTGGHHKHCQKKNH